MLLLNSSDERMAFPSCLPEGFALISRGRQWTYQTFLTPGRWSQKYLLPCTFAPPYNQNMGLSRFRLTKNPSVRVNGRINERLFRYNEKRILSFFVTMAIAQHRTAASKKQTRSILSRFLGCCVFLWFMASISASRHQCGRLLVREAYMTVVYTELLAENSHSFTTQYMPSFDEGICSPRPHKWLPSGRIWQCPILPIDHVPLRWHIRKPDFPLGFTGDSLIFIFFVGLIGDMACRHKPLFTSGCDFF